MQQIHKSQGKTYDNAYVLIDKSVGYESFNVMATRHRDLAKFYVDGHLLNEVIARKYDRVTEYSNDHKLGQKQNIQTSNPNHYQKQEAAIFELLVRRENHHFASDYIGYEARGEVILIKSYLAARDKVSDLYVELLDWRTKANTTRQKMIDQANEQDKIGQVGVINRVVKDPKSEIKLWDNHDLWQEFKEAKNIRDDYASEIVENYGGLRKYIGSSSINYSTLLKHAKSSLIKFDYSDSNSNINSKAIKVPNIILEQDYQKILLASQALGKNYNKKDATALEHEARKLSYDHEAHKITLSNVSCSLAQNRQDLWQLSSNKKAYNYFEDDFKHYLKKTYKDSPEVILDCFAKISKATSIQKALNAIEADPKILGKLSGMGLGSFFSINMSHAEAVFNTKSLKLRMGAYTDTKAKIASLDQDILVKEANIKSLESGFNKMSQLDSLSEDQERYLYQIQKLATKEKSFVNYINNIGNNNTKEDRSINLSAKESLTHNDIDIDKKANDKSIESNNQKRQNMSYKHDYSISQIHDKLALKVVELASELLPRISDKKIEIDHNHIKCGSIFVSLESGKEGLWYRFSDNNERGNLFDLIKVANKYSDFKEVINYAKDYLGIEGHNSLPKVPRQTNSKEDHKVTLNTGNALEKDLSDRKQSRIFNKLKANDVKLIMPVPEKAERFNPNKVLYHHLKDNNKQLEKIYEYRNIDNKLCSYVARINDLSSKDKLTLPIVYTENTLGIKSWRSKGFGENRTLYNEQALKNSNKPVLIVEGEKTADAAMLLYPEVDVVSWSGGANAYAKSNWSVLAGKKVGILPDHDNPGMKASHGIKEILETQVKHCNIIDIEEVGNFPNKWDLADKLPENVHAHQVTGIVLSSCGVDDNIRIERASKEYVDMRKLELQEELKEITLDGSFADYLKEIDKNEKMLKLEAQVIKKELKDYDYIRNSRSVFVRIDASKLYRAEEENIMNKLYQDQNNNSLQDHAHNLASSLAKLHPEQTHEALHVIAKIALDHSHKLITDTTENRMSIHSIKDNPIDDIDNNSHHHLLDKSCLLPMATILSNRIINHDDKNHNIHDSHVMDNIKIEFSQKMEHDMVNYTASQHQQQSLQLQRSNQMTM